MHEVLNLTPFFVHSCFSLLAMSLPVFFSCFFFYFMHTYILKIIVFQNLIALLWPKRLTKRRKKERV